MVCGVDLVVKYLPRSHLNPHFLSRSVVTGPSEGSLSWTFKHHHHSSDHRQADYLYGYQVNISYFLSSLSGLNESVVRESEYCVFSESSWCV